MGVGVGVSVGVSVGVTVNSDIDSDGAVHFSAAQYSAVLHIATAHHSSWNGQSALCDFR